MMTPFDLTIIWIVGENAGLFVFCRNIWSYFSKKNDQVFILLIIIIRKHMLDFLKIIRLGKVKSGKK